MNLRNQSLSPCSAHILREIELLPDLPQVSGSFHGQVAAVVEYFARRCDPRQSGFPLDEFWKHSLACGCCAELLAREVQGAALDASEAFACGFLHDLGKPALAMLLPRAYGRVAGSADLTRGDIADIERKTLAVDHLSIGKRLAEHWRLPTSIRDCAWLHGQPTEALPAGLSDARLVQLITLCDLVVRREGLGYSGNYDLAAPDEGLLANLGITAAHVEHAIKRLPRRMADFTALLSGRARLLPSQLPSTKSDLAPSHPLGESPADVRLDSIHSILEWIARGALQILGADVVAAFSIGDSKWYAESVICSRQGGVALPLRIDLPPGFELRHASRDRIARVSPDLEWLVWPISPELGHDRRCWMGIEHAGRCIGGIIWGTAAEPSELVNLNDFVSIRRQWSAALCAAQATEQAQELAEQLAESNRKLQNAHARLLGKSAIESVAEMAAGAAHEMNNPLAVISGRAQLLAGALSDPRQRATTELLQEQAERLGAMITELMDFARPRPGNPAGCNITDIVQRAVDQAKLQNDPADRQIDVSIGDVPPICADGQQVSAALGEVISNAIAATSPSAGRIGIRADFDADSHQVVITVIDNGCGMSAADLKRAFDPFFSAKPAGRRRGMGLAKARRWIEASGGSIRLESTPGRETRATIVLAAQSPNDTQVRPTASQYKARTG